MRAFAEAGATDFAPVELTLEPRRRRRDPRAAQGRRRRRPRLMGDLARRSTSSAERCGRPGSSSSSPPTAGSCSTGCRRGRGRSTTTSRSPMLETMPSGGRLEMVTDATAHRARRARSRCVQLGAEPGTAGRLRPRRRRRARRRRVDAHRDADRDRPVHRRGRLPARRPGHHPLRRPAGRREARRGVAAERGGHPPARAARRRRGAAARRRAARGGGCTTAARSPTASRRRGRPACGRWSPRACAGVDLQSFALRRPVPARPVRGPHDRRSSPPTSSACKLGINIVNADSMRERTFVPARPRLPRPDPRPPPRRARSCVITPITCPVAEDHPGPDRRRRRRPVRGRTSGPTRAGPRRAHPAADPGARGRDRRRPPGGRRRRTSTCSRGPTSSGPTTSATCPTASTRTPPATSAWASASTPSPSRATAPSPLTRV